MTHEGTIACSWIAGKQEERESNKESVCERKKEREREIQIIRAML